MKTKQDFIAEMENSNALMTNKYTHAEYVSELRLFQNTICKMIAGNAYHEGMHAEEGRLIMEAKARKKGIRENDVVMDAITSMKALDKEAAVTFSGVAAEGLVARTLKHLNRPNTQIFRNIYVSDGQYDTEIDDIVLTDQGIIILEVKNVRTDVIIDTDGRLLVDGETCYDRIPLGQKMQLKRRALRTALEKAVADRGIDIPIHIDSFIVFNAPKGKFINVDDRYHLEKYCFRTGINKKIEWYLGIGSYNSDQLAQLGEIIAEIAANEKQFEVSVDYNEIRSNVAEALALLQDEPTAQKAPEAKKKKAAKHLGADIFGHNLDFATRLLRQTQFAKVSPYYTAAGMVVGLALTGAAAVLDMKRM